MKKLIVTAFCLWFANGAVPAAAQGTPIDPQTPLIHDSAGKTVDSYETDRMVDHKLRFADRKQRHKQRFQDRKQRHKDRKERHKERFKERKDRRKDHMKQRFDRRKDHGKDGFGRSDDDQSSHLKTHRGRLHFS